MSLCRKNSVRDKLIDKRWIYLERNILHRKSVGPLRRTMAMVNFYGLVNFIGQ